VHVPGDGKLSPKLKWMMGIVANSHKPVGKVTVDMHFGSTG